jgi:hypothetical protein
MEQGVVVDEHNVDPAGIVGVGVHNGIGPMRMQKTNWRLAVPR